MPLANPLSRQQRINSHCLPDIPPLLARLRQMTDRWPDRLLLGEVGGEGDLEVAARFTQPGHLHQSYCFRLLGMRLTATALRELITQAENTLQNGWLCWATGNHDVMRAVSRWGKDDGQSNPALAKLCLAFGLSMRGSFCLYQGEELGLPEVDVPYALMHDPFGKAFYPEFKGRDGCRTPMPWQKDRAHYGFSNAAQTWLPCGPTHGPLAVSEQDGAANSVLTFARTLLKWRKTQPVLRLGTLDLLPTTNAAVTGWKRFHEGQEISCWFNLSDQPQSLTVNGTLFEAVSNGQLTGQSLTLPAFGFAFLHH
jgi:alpha-glucosidase